MVRFIIASERLELIVLLSWRSEEEIWMTNWCSTNYALHVQHKCENNVYSKLPWPSHILSAFARIYDYLSQVDCEKLQQKGPDPPKIPIENNPLRGAIHWTLRKKQLRTSRPYTCKHLTPKKPLVNILLPRIELLNKKSLTNHQLQLQPAAPEAPKEFTFIAPGHHWIAHTSRKCQS